MSAASHFTRRPFCGTDDESFRRRTRVVKGVTGDQRQQLTRGRLQNPRLVGVDGIGEPDTVDVLPSRNRNSDEIAGLEFTQTPKESIAVRGNRNVARFPWSAVPGIWPAAILSIRGEVPSATITET
jgi:hypothetical protein